MNITLSNLLFNFNLIVIRVVNILNYLFVKKELLSKTILINTQYFQRNSIIEAIFGNYLKHNGKKVYGLVCAGYKYCEMHKMNSEIPNCNACRQKTFKLLDAAKIEAIDLEDFKNISEDLNNKKFNFKSLKNSKHSETEFPLGETAYWNWLHYSNGDILPEDNKENNNTLKNIYETTCGSHDSINAVIKKYKPDFMVTCHGKFAQTRPAFFLREIHNYDCLTWENFAMDSSFVWLKNALAMDQNINKYWPTISNSKLSKIDYKKVDKYFEDQKTGVNQKWTFLDKITMVDKNDIYEKTNLNKDKPIISIFPPIAWDSTGCSHTLEDLNFFEVINFLVNKCIEYKNVQFVVRSHPAELNVPDYLRSSRSIVDTLIKVNKEIPSNVFFLHADSEISSHALSAISNEVIFFSSTLGLEVLNSKRKVNCIGVQAYYSQKGFTNDILTKKQLLDLFENLEKLSLSKDSNYKYECIDDRQLKYVKTLTFYIRFKLHSFIGILKRGILLLTLFRYISYLQYMKNLSDYLLGKRLPFDL